MPVAVTVISGTRVSRVSSMPCSGEPRSHASRVQLSVLDECGGIPALDLERVFDVAWRGTAARTPELPAAGTGAGLGLAIVKGIVEAHHGNVTVDNRPVGCRFTVTLPAV